MFTYARVSLEEVFTAMDEGMKHLPVDEFLPKVTGHRLTLFHTQGITCVACGLTATCFLLQAHREGDRPHFNLMHLPEGAPPAEAILFTKDHIHPKSLGGPDRQDNFQVMCAPCNGKKGSRLPEVA